MATTAKKTPKQNRVRIRLKSYDSRLIDASAKRSQMLQKTPRVKLLAPFLFLLIVKYFVYSVPLTLTKNPASTLKSAPING